MSGSFSVAVVGVGGWGKNLLRNFATISGSRVDYVCDLSETARAAAASAYPSTRCVDDYRRALDDASVAAVVVATDAPSHYEVARAALLAGKDVFVEKPLALSSQHGEELCTLADRGQRILMVGHLLLYHPALEALRKLVDEGELGEILYVYAQRLNLGVVRRDENAWWSLAPHDVAVANYLLGQQPESVIATGASFLQRDQNVHDVVFATLNYPANRLAHVHVSWLDPHKTRRLTIVGSKKMAVFDDASPDQKLILFDKGVEQPQSVSYEEGVRIRTGDIRIPALRMQEPLRRECEAFVRAVQTRKPPLADGRSGLAVVKVLEAGNQSLRDGSRPIRMGG